MGWFWGSSDNDDDKKSQDPLRNLDPSLREFLAKESPIKYSSTNPPSTEQAPSSTAPEAPSQSKYSNAVLAADKPQERQVPTQFPDGRYADLWKNYRPLAEIEADGKSDQEKINDVLDGFNHRRQEIGKAALENCALEQWDVNECFQNGGWKSRMTMCRKENRKFERCYMMQAKFLKALGYLSTFDRPPEVDEQIQMHADTLYHRMMAQEKQIEEAKENGLPAPTFSPLLSTRPTGSALSTPPMSSTLGENKTKPSDLPAKVQAGLKKRLDGLNDEEREVEERAIKAEIQAGEQVAATLGKVYEKQEAERKIRKEQGRETMGDKISSMFGSFR